MTTNIWYDADTLLEEVLDTMPEDIQGLFEDYTPIRDEYELAENDMTQTLNEMDAEAANVEDELQEFFDNACCPNASYAARTLCGCRGSGDPTNLSDAARRVLEDRQMP